MFPGAGQSSQYGFSLTDKSESTPGTYKDILGRIIKGIDSKACYKIFRGIKKYQGRYEDELRYIICLNEERKTTSEKKFDGIFVFLSSHYDLEPCKVVETYKNLKEVEMLFD